MAAVLPPREFVSSLISSISSQSSSTTTTTTLNPLLSAASDTRKALLTLHVLFPNELLPALDLLDRGLVTRLICQDEAQRRTSSDTESGHRLQLQHQHSVPPGHQPDAAEREVGQLHRPIQDSSRLGVAGDPVRQYSGLGQVPGLREVQSQGQSEVWSERRQSLHPERGQIEDQHTKASTAQAETHAHGQSSRELQVQHNPEHESTRRQRDRNLLTSEQRLRSQISSETNLRPPNPHTQESLLRRPGPDSSTTTQHNQTNSPNPQNLFHQTHPPASPHQDLHSHDNQNPRIQTPQCDTGRPKFRMVSHAHHADVYMVRSAAAAAGVQRRGRFRDSGGGGGQALPCYEVRVQAWSCSCPAFVFAAFPAVVPERVEDGQDGSGVRSEGEWRFGGLTLGSDMPVCKHLLACVLVGYCGLFAGFVEERVVSVEELAGWAAGWGD